MKNSITRSALAIAIASLVSSEAALALRHR